MNSNQFNAAEVKWANGILAQPSYVMPNGKPSHQVAHEVLAGVMDRLVERGTVNAYGQWNFK